jgi:hypothetical protein
MQAISVYLYPNKLDVFTNLPSEWLQERYRQVYNRNVKIYRGVDNRVDLQARNSDEKKQDMTGYTLVFRLIARETQELLLEKDCTSISLTDGRAYVTLTEAELANIEPGSYQYSVVKEVRTDIDEDTYVVTSRTPMYIDSQYGTLATIEIGKGLKGEPLETTKVIAFSKHQSFGEPFDTYYVSSIIDARPELSSPQSLHTFQINLSAYSGNLTIQGSISDGGNPQVWTTIESFTATDSSTLYKNVTGKYNWFRVKHTPSTANTGTVDSILYR